jgi:hypothetical protein
MFGGFDEKCVLSIQLPGAVELQVARMLVLNR